MQVEGAGAIKSQADTRAMSALLGLCRVCGASRLDVDCIDDPAKQDTMFASGIVADLFERRLACFIIIPDHGKAPIERGAP